MGQRLHALQNSDETIPGLLDPVTGFLLDYVDVLPEFLMDLFCYHHGNAGRCSGSPAEYGMYSVDIVDVQTVQYWCSNNVENGAGVQQ